jgi:hypothetical protein
VRPRIAARERLASAADSSASGSASSSATGRTGQAEAPRAARRSARDHPRTSPSVGGEAGMEAQSCRPARARRRRPARACESGRGRSPPRRSAARSSPSPVSPPASPWRRAWRRYALRSARTKTCSTVRAEPVVVGESVAQPVWHREHPLSDGHVGRQHMIDEGAARSAIRRPRSSADRAPLAREGDQALERAVPAPHAREAMGQHPRSGEISGTP